MHIFITKQTEKLLFSIFTDLCAQHISEFMGCDKIGIIVENIGIGKFIDRGIPDHPNPSFINPRDAGFIRLGEFRVCHGFDFYEGQTFRFMARYDNENYVLCVAPDTMYGSRNAFAETPDLRVRQFWEISCKSVDKVSIIDFYVHVVDEILKTTLICPLCGMYEKMDGYVDKHCKKCMRQFNLNPCISCGINFGVLKQQRHIMCHKKECRLLDIKMAKMNRIELEECQDKDYTEYL